MSAKKNEPYLEKKIIRIYTDGSCNTQLKVGGWAAILLLGENKKVLHGSESNTTHNRMELLAVIKSLEYAVKNFNKMVPIELYTDSQYVYRIPERAEKLQSNHFITKKGNVFNNKDLIQRLIELINQHDICIIKVKAHQKNIGIPNYNREVDKLSRQIVRDKVKHFINYK